MEVGCLRHPGASTIGSQLLDGDCSHGWQILATQLRAPMQERENCLDDEVPLQTTPQVRTQSTQKIALNEEQMKFRRMRYAKTADY